MAEIKNITTRSFGLIIAYLLPGFVCVLAISYWWVSLRELIENFLKSKSDVGSFLFALLLCLLLGLLMNAIRWVVYEKCFLRRHELPSGYFVKMSQSDRLLAVHTAIDENFRYHQFYGNLSLVIPVLYIELLLSSFTAISPLSVSSCRFCVISVATIVFLVIETAIIWAAVAAFLRYIGRTMAIMKGE